MKFKKTSFLLSAVSLSLAGAYFWFDTPVSAAPQINITDKTAPAIAELYNKYQETQEKLTALESERGEALQKNLDAMRETEQSLANRTLTAASTAATGLGTMAAASAIAEQRADAAAERDMSAYLETLHCEYANGKNFKYSPEEITLPGGNELIAYRTEYMEIAERLKKVKEALKLAPGLEAEAILDRAEAGLYDDVAIGKTGGAYASLANALTDESGKDAAEIAAQKEGTATKLKAGAIAAGVGVVGGAIGNAIINKDAPKEESAKINTEYNNKRDEIKKDADEIEENLNAAIAENAAAVQEYNNTLQQHQDLIAQIQACGATCEGMFDEYIETVNGCPGKIENETDAVEGCKFPDIDAAQTLLTNLQDCAKQGGTFEDGECKLPEPEVKEEENQNETEPQGTEEEPTPETNETKEEETEIDPDICEVGKPHRTGFGIKEGVTRVGDFCSSPGMVLDGVVVRRNTKERECGCHANICDSRNGLVATKGGGCECDASNGYIKNPDKKTYKGTCICNEANGWKKDEKTGICVNPNAGKTSGSTKKLTFSYCCDPNLAKAKKTLGGQSSGTIADRLNGDKSKKSTSPKQEDQCECVDFFIDKMVTQMEAAGLAYEYTRRNKRIDRQQQKTYAFNDEIACEDTFHNVGASQALACTSTKDKTKHYDFTFNNSIQNGNPIAGGNTGFWRALCSIWGLKTNNYFQKENACVTDNAGVCSEISAAIKRTFYQDGSATLFTNEKKQTMCAIEEHPTLRSAKSGVLNDVVLKDELQTIKGIDSLRFFDKQFSFKASTDITQGLTKYLFKELGLPMQKFNCDRGFHDNVNIINMTAEEYKTTMAQREKCFSQIDYSSSRMLGPGSGGYNIGQNTSCIQRYPTPEIHGDVLTCHYDGQPIDFVFNTLDTYWGKVDRAARQSMECYNQDGEPDGKNCALLCDPAKEDCAGQCNKMDRDFRNKFPESKGMAWDVELGMCVMKDAKDVARARKVAEVGGMIVLTVVTSVAGGPVVWVAAAVEAGALYVEADAEAELAEWSTMFLRDAQRCKDDAPDAAQCASKVLKQHAARMIDGAKYFSETQINANSRQLGRLIVLLDSDEFDKIVDFGEKNGYFSENKDPNWEVLKAYYKTKLTKDEENLILKKQIATGLTFATLFVGGVLAGMRQAAKRGWIKLTPDKLKKWTRLRILTKDDYKDLIRKAYDEMDSVSTVGKAADATGDVVKLSPKEAKTITNPRIAELEKKKAASTLTAEESKELKQLHNQREHILNEHKVNGVKNSEAVGKAATQALDEKAIKKAQSEYDNILKERENFFANAKKHGRTPSDAEIKAMNDKVAGAEQKLRDLGKDVTPAEPLPLNSTKAKPTAPKGTDAPKPETAPKSTTPTPTAAPKPAPKPVASNVDEFTALKERAAPDFDARLKRLKEGETVSFGRNGMSDSEWDKIGKGLEKDGYQMKKSGDFMYVSKKSTGAADAATDAARVTSGATTSGKGALNNVQELENKLNNFSDLKQGVRNGQGKTAVFNKGSLNDDQWKALNESLAKDNMELVPSGKNMVLRKKLTTTDKISDIRGRVYSEFNTHTKNIKNGVEKELHIPKSHLSNDEWKILESDLRNEGLEIAEANSNYFTVRKSSGAAASVTDDAASAARNAGPKPKNTPTPTAAPKPAPKPVASNVDEFTALKERANIKLDDWLKEVDNGKRTTASFGVDNLSKSDANKLIQGLEKQGYKVEKTGDIVTVSKKTTSTANAADAGKGVSNTVNTVNKASGAATGGINDFLSRSSTLQDLNKQGKLALTNSSSLGGKEYLRINMGKNPNMQEAENLIKKLQGEGFYVSSNTAQGGERFIGVSRENVFGPWSKSPNNWALNKVDDAADAVRGVSGGVKTKSEKIAAARESGNLGYHGTDADIAMDDVIRSSANSSDRLGSVGYGVARDYDAAEKYAVKRLVERQNLGKSIDFYREGDVLVIESNETLNLSNKTGYVYTTAKESSVKWETLRNGYVGAFDAAQMPHSVEVLDKKAFNLDDLVRQGKVKIIEPKSAGSRGGKGSRKLFDALGNAADIGDAINNIFGN